MIKKIITLSILGTLLFSSTALAKGTSTSTPSSTVRQVNSTCVTAAVNKRDASIKTAQDAFSKAMTDARSTRKSALSAASNLTDKAAKKSARKAAETAFKDASKTARDAFRNARKLAQDQFETGRKACKTTRSSK